MNVFHVNSENGDSLLSVQFENVRSGDLEGFSHFQYYADM